MSDTWGRWAFVCGVEDLILSISPEDWHTIMAHFLRSDDVYNVVVLYMRKELYGEGAWLLNVTGKGSPQSFVVSLCNTFLVRFHFRNFIQLLISCRAQWRRQVKSLRSRFPRLQPGSVRVLVACHSVFVAPGSDNDISQTMSLVTVRSRRNPSVVP